MAIDCAISGDFSACELRGGGDEIHRAGDFAAHGRFHLPWPPRDAGNAHAAFPGAAFALAQKARAAAGLAHQRPWAVVAAEDDQRVLREAVFTQRVEHAADAPVEFLDDIAIKPAAAFVFERGRRKQRRVRESVREIEEERLRLVRGDEFHRFLGVAACQRGLICGLFDEFEAPIERRVPILGFLIGEGVRELRIARVRVHVVRVRQAEVEVEAVILRMMGRIEAPHAEMPFSDETGAVAFALQKLCEGDFIVGKPAARKTTQHARLVMAHAVANRVPTRHERRAARCADFCRRVELREPHALRRHAIEMRRADGGMPVAAQIAVTEVIGVNDDDVRSCEERRAQGREEKKEAKKHGEAPKRDQRSASSSETNGKDAAIVLR